ncbi:hypothetical protein [Candidatus Pollutiaquabacter sp.]|uniref:hypothetical protein n=1 Tax=Candidatus Pollutiaquabacter sp. TaxID=3416354 RepID=UPI003CC376AE|nr:hypothetical protein [Bacteroidota bacterium]
MKPIGAAKFRSEHDHYRLGPGAILLLTAQRAMRFDTKAILYGIRECFLCTPTYSLPYRAYADAAGNTAFATRR